jgi:hypothetical protein
VVIDAFHIVDDLAEQVQPVLDSLFGILLWRQGSVGPKRP